MFKNISFIMNRIELDQNYSPYQMPTVIIGTIVDNNPNFMLCTWLSRVNRNPSLWMVSINKRHYTVNGIRENKVFSMNFPTVDILKKMDFIGITSGRDVDKSSLFNLFYGVTNAPMVEECALNMELIVKDQIELPDHFIILGNAEKTYISEIYLTKGKPDVKKMNLIIYTGAEKQPIYWALGNKLGDAFKIGQSIKK